MLGSSDVSETRCVRHGSVRSRVARFGWLGIVLFVALLVSLWLTTGPGRRPAEASITAVPASTPVLSPSVPLVRGASPAPPHMLAIVDRVLKEVPDASVVTPAPTFPPGESLAAPTPAAALGTIELPTPSPTVPAPGLSTPTPDALLLPTQPVVAPAVAAAVSLSRCWEPSELRHDPGLEAVIRKVLGSELERYGVVVRNLTDGTEVSIQPEKVFYAASLYKLAVLYEVYRQERAGRLSFSEPLEVTPESAEWDLGTLALLGWSVGSVITVAQAVEAMVTVSDNTSAVLLSGLVGWSSIDEGLRELGLRSTRVNDPTLPVTAADLARLLDRIACGAAVDEQASREMIGLLARQRVRDRLPALLPEGTVVAHKTGNWTDATHDAGIVFSPRATYVIVVLSETAWRPEPIARLSAAVYEYSIRPRVPVSQGRGACLHQTRKLQPQPTGERAELLLGQLLSLLHRLVDGSEHHIFQELDVVGVEHRGIDLHPLHGA